MSTDSNFTPGTAPVNLPGGFVSTIVGSTGFVALLDVLGFRELIASDSGSRLLGDYLITIESALHNRNVETVVFSDSVVLTKNGSDAESLRDLCQTVSILMFHLIARGIPVRGAISHGQFHSSPVKGSVFIAGRPIVDAYDFEQRQDWVGAMLTPSALKAVNKEIDLRTHCITQVEPTPGLDNLPLMKWKSIVQCCDKVPMKCGDKREYFDGCAIVPGGSSDPPAIADHLAIVIARLEWLKALAPTPGAQDKYVDTIRWLIRILQFAQNTASAYGSFRAAKS